MNLERVRCLRAPVKSVLEAFGNTDNVGFSAFATLQTFSVIASHLPLQSTPPTALSLTNHTYYNIARPLLFSRERKMHYSKLAPSTSRQVTAACPICIL